MPANSIKNKYSQSNLRHRPVTIYKNINKQILRRDKKTHSTMGGKIKCREKTFACVAENSAKFGSAADGLVQLHIDTFAKKKLSRTVTESEELANSRFRNQLSQRITTYGHKALFDFELLELLLYDPNLQSETRILVSRLLDAFGDISGVLTAPELRLRKVHGATHLVISKLRLAHAIAERLAQVRVLERNVISCWDDLIEYCRISMASCETEQFRVFFMNRKNMLIADELQASGTVDHVPVYPREIVKRALELNASALILVHNHPSGDPSPSKEDIAMTDRICIACGAIDVVVHDHIIVGRGKEISLRSAGYLSEV